MVRSKERKQKAPPAENRQGIDGSGGGAPRALYQDPTGIEPRRHW
jgi:hypothetical protein